jgi:hypothetical protein
MQPLLSHEPRQSRPNLSQRAFSAVILACTALAWSTFTSRSRAAITPTSSPGIAQRCQRYFRSSTSCRRINARGRTRSRGLVASLGRSNPALEPSARRDKQAPRLDRGRKARSSVRERLREFVMEVAAHSITAVMVAAIRAYHSADPEPRIFHDALARVLLLPGDCEAFESPWLISP